jgi:L-lactate dehydrogenase complex protein LldE
MLGILACVLMRVALFVPCYVDQLRPAVALATVRLLERLGVEVAFPEEQTCCGQPMANAGVTDAVGPLARRFLEVFRGFDAVVCPSGSCTSMVRNHYDPYLGGEPGFDALKRGTYELCEFLVDVLGVKALDGAFAHKVALHQSCHGLRELGLGVPSERLLPRTASKPAILLQSLRGIQLVPLARPDECCGFGGTFAVAEEAVSCLMGKDRIGDHAKAGAEIVTATDVSCLMHLDGIARRERVPLRFLHVAEVLAEAVAPVPGSGGDQG